MKSTIASMSVSVNFCGGIPESGVTAAGVMKCCLSQSGERRAPTLSSSGAMVPPTPASLWQPRPPTVSQNSPPPAGPRAGGPADSGELVAAAAADGLEKLAAAGQLRGGGVVAGLVALPAGRLDVFLRQHRLVPMRHVAVGVLNIGGTALAAVADGAAELVERVLVMQGEGGEGLRVSAVARILDREMASRAPVDAVELGQEDLADLHRRALGQQPLVRRRRA